MVCGYCVYLNSIPGIYSCKIMIIFNLAFIQALSAYYTLDDPVFILAQLFMWAPL